MAALLVGAEVVLPGWFAFWRGAAREYVYYHRPSLLANLLGKQTALVVALGGLVLCGIVFWRARKDLPGAEQFNFALVTALVMTELIVPNAGGGAFYNQLILIPAALWLLTSGRRWAKENALASFTWKVAVTVLAGGWLLASLVSFGALALHLHFNSDAQLVPGAPALLVYEFPLALALFRVERRSPAPPIGAGLRPLGIILGALICAAGIWLYAQRVMIPYQTIDAAAHDRPRGNLSDLYPRWVGTRELLLHGRDPYGPVVTAEIQAGYQTFAAEAAGGMQR